MKNISEAVSAEYSEPFYTMMEEDAPIDHVMKRLVLLSILLVLSVVFVFELPDTPSTFAAPIPGANSNVSKVWWSNSTGLFDQTSAANNPAVSDVQLAGDVGDIHYIGHVSARSSRIYYNITGGIDVSGAVVWEYWNGLSWRLFPTVIDSSRNFTRFGVQIVDFATAPTDWAQTTIPVSPRRLAFTAFYARARTILPYAPDAVPRAAQASLFLVPVAKIDITVDLWNGTGVPDANVSLWLPGPPPVQRVELTMSNTDGIYEFAPAQHQLTDGQSYFIRVAKIGYKNITTTVFTYNASLPVNDKGVWILHGSLQVNVKRAFSPFTGIFSPTGLVDDQSVPAASGTGNGTGTIEFGVDWRSHPQVNVTISKPGWVTNSTSRSITITPWTTTAVSFPLQTTVRVNAISEQPLGQLIPKATVTVRDSAGNIFSFADNSTLDQDKTANGIAYLAVDPSSITNPVSVTVSRPGFSNWATSSQVVRPSAQLNLTSSNQYGFRVKAWDELNNATALTMSDTSFTGLVISQVDFYQGTAYMAADPVSPGRLTITKTGYISTTTTTTVRPPSPTAFVNQTITYRPTGGTGPGLPFTVKVVSVSNELGTSLPSASVTAPGVTPVPSGGLLYFALPASSPVNLTASAQGYVDTNATVTPSSSSQTTVRFGTFGSPATVNAQGLPFTVKIVGVYNELGNRFQIGVNSTVTSSSGTVTVSSANGYLAASVGVTLTASASGYVDATVAVTPSRLSQTTVLFKTAGTGATIVRPGLLFTVKVVSVSDELGNLLAGASVTSSVAPLVSGGQFYFPLPPSTPVTLTASAQGYVNSAASLTPVSASQTTVRFGAAGGPATVNAPGLPFTVKIAGLFDELSTALQIGASTTITSSAGTVVVSSGSAYLAASTSVDLNVAATGYVDATVNVAPTLSSQTTILFKTGGTGATVVRDGLKFTLKVLVSQSWDATVVQGATVDVFSDQALTNKILSAQSDTSGTAYLPVDASTAYVQVSKTGYSTYKSSALQISSSSQASVNASFGVAVSTVTAKGTTISVSGNTNLSDLAYDSAANKITITSTSTATGNVNVTIPKQLIPSGYTIQVTANGQAVNYNTMEDANNVYLQKISTSAGTSNLEIAFQAPSPFQSPVLLGGLAVAVVVVIGAAAYLLMRRRKPMAKPTSPPSK